MRRSALMGYTYLTITGYDNISPTTTYAKLLSSSASLLQIFFFVFFNSLLSMKMSRDALAAEDTERPGARRHGEDRRPARNPQGASLNGEDDMSEAKETLDEMKTLLRQIKGRRHFRF